MNCAFLVVQCAVSPTCTVVGPTCTCTCTLYIISALLTLGCLAPVLCPGEYAGEMERGTGLAPGKTPI